MTQYNFLWHYSQFLQFFICAMWLFLCNFIQLNSCYLFYAARTINVFDQERTTNKRCVDIYIFGFCVHVPIVHVCIWRRLKAHNSSVCWIRSLAELLHIRANTFVYTRRINSKRLYLLWRKIQKSNGKWTVSSCVLQNSFHTFALSCMFHQKSSSNTRNKLLENYWISKM